MNAPVAESPEGLEPWYDAHVAPALLKLGNECADRGIPFLAVVGYDGSKGSSGRTACMPAERAEFFNVLDTAARCHVDGGGFHLDAFLGALIRHAREHGHSSIYLSQLGIPVQPKGATA